MKKLTIHIQQTNPPATMTFTDSPRIPNTFYISNNIENYKNVCVRNGNIIQSGIIIDIADVFHFNIPNTRNYCMGEATTQIRIRRSSITSNDRFAGMIDILNVSIATCKMAYEKEPYRSNYLQELQQTCVSETPFTNEYATVFEKLRDKLVFTFARTSSSPAHPPIFYGFMLLCVLWFYAFRFFYAFRAKTMPPPKGSVSTSRRRS